MNGLAVPVLSGALITETIRAGSRIVFDVFGCVFIKHPWNLSFKEFCADCKPWITLIYLSILVGPTGGYLFTDIIRYNQRLKR